MSSPIKSWVSAIALLWLCASPTLLAQNGDSLDIHGFFSQTYINTSQNNFLIPNSSKGSFEWTEGAINVSKTWGKFRLGAQAIARDFGDEGNFRVDADWAYLDVSISNPFNLRLGRARLPFGLYNEYRDVDAARMEILFPQVFNPEDYRAGAVAYQGLGIYGTLGSARKGSLEYQVYFGNNHLHKDFFLARRIQDGFLSPTTEMTTRRLAGGQLIWNTPMDGLRLCYTHLNYKGDFNINSPIAGGLVDDRGIIFRIRWHLLGLEYTFGPWQFVAEYLYRDNENIYSDRLSAIFGRSFMPENTVSGYLTIRRQMTDKLGTYLSYGQLHKEIAQDGAPLSDRHNELSLGFRYDILEPLIFKSQISSMRGHYGTLGTGAKSSDWFMFTSRISITF
jgi:hypothetical protein